MVLGGVECGEVVIIRFYLRPFKHLKTHACKNVNQLVFDKRNGVECTCLIRLTRHGDVNAFLGVLCLKLHLFHNDGAFFKQRFHRLFKLVDDLAKGGTFLFR